MCCPPWLPPTAHNPPVFHWRPPLQIAFHTYKALLSLCAQNLVLGSRVLWMQCASHFHLTSWLKFNLWWDPEVIQSSPELLSAGIDGIDNRWAPSLAHMGSVVVSLCSGEAGGQLTKYFSSNLCLGDTLLGELRMTLKKNLFSTLKFLGRKFGN